MGANEVSVAEVQKLIKDDAVYLIDVRNPNEMGADGNDYIKAKKRINIPLPDFEAALKLSVEEFKSKYNFDKPCEDGSDVVIHCGTGRRSGMALKIMQNCNYTKAKHMPGGYGKWVEETKS